MVKIPFNLGKSIKWKLDIYEADGYYIKDVLIIIEINMYIQIKI